MCMRKMCTKKKRLAESNIIFNKIGNDIKYYLIFTVGGLRNSEE